MRQNKYLYLHVVQGDYGFGYGFEDLAASESRAEALRDLRDYRREEGIASYRMIKRRELNPEYTASP